MKDYIIRRLLTSIVVLFGVSIILYGVIRLMPGDYIENTMASKIWSLPSQLELLSLFFGPEIFSLLMASCW